MAIDFEPAPSSLEAIAYYRRLALEQMRPLSRAADEHEHAPPQAWIDHYWNVVRKQSPAGSGPSDGFVRVCMQAE